MKIKTTEQKVDNIVSILNDQDVNHFVSGLKKRMVGGLVSPKKSGRTRN